MHKLLVSTIILCKFILQISIYLCKMILLKTTIVITLQLLHYNHNVKIATTKFINRELM